MIDEKREINALVKPSKEIKCKKLLVITDDYEAGGSAEGRKLCLFHYGNGFWINVSYF